MKENSLAVLADGYISPMLLNTLMRQRIPALAQNERLENELRRYCPGLVLLSSSEAEEKISKANSLIYASSEEVLPIILSSSKNQSRIENINLFLDKARFRQLLKDICPGSSCKDALRDDAVEEAGGEIAEETVEVAVNKSETNEATGKATDLHIPVKSKEKYACDAYFNSRSKPVVLGIYSHPRQSEEDERDLVYYTNAGIIREMHPRVDKLLRDLSSRLKIKNFPLHMEFVALGDDLMPVKISPMRFGDFGLPDLLLFAYGINSYGEYFLKQEPDWQEILANSGDETYFWVLSKLPPGMPANLKPDHDEYAETFQDLIGYCKLDLKRYPAFSIAFAKTKNIDEILKYLSFSFESFMKLDSDES